MFGGPGGLGRRMEARRPEFRNRGGGAPGPGSSAGRRPCYSGSRCFMGISLGLALVEGLPAAGWPHGLMCAPRSGTRRRGKRLGRRLDGRRAARRPCHPQKTFVERLLEPGLAASIAPRGELNKAVIEPNPTSSRRRRPPDVLQREMAQICTILLLEGKRPRCCR